MKTPKMLTNNQVNHYTNTLTREWQEAKTAMLSQNCHIPCCNIFKLMKIIRTKNSTRMVLKIC